MKYFYTHLVEIESLVVELDDLGLSAKEKKELAALVDSMIHSSIMEMIFLELNEHDKEKFIEYLKNDEKDEIWEFLNKRIDKIKDKIKTVADELKEDLKKDIKQSKRKKEI